MLEGVRFHAEVYGDEVSRLLALRGAGEAEMPLTRSSPLSQPAREALSRRTALEVFPRSATPEAALAGLYLYFGCWDEAHQHADAAGSRENYYWHAIVHRQEPDAWNSGYWFRKAGAHPVFAELAREAREAGYPGGDRWDPIAFVNFCESARALADSEEARMARRVQLIEWQLLFAWSAQESTH
jgi:hypothetical protein